MAQLSEREEVEIMSLCACGRHYIADGLACADFRVADGGDPVVRRRWGLA